MIELIPTEMDDVVAWRIDGKVSEDAFDEIRRFLAQLEKCIGRSEEVMAFLCDQLKKLTY